MQFSVLSSGSKANSTYFEANGTGILIDCGLSAKQTEIRLRMLGIDPETLDGIIVTHEHGDHIRGLSVLSRRWEIPIYANELTADFFDNIYAVELFNTGENFSVGNLDISNFSVLHDAYDPVGFFIEAEGLKFTHATDLGRVTPQVRDAMFCSNALVLESNHDAEMLETCFYPWEVKQRIASSRGHLSNLQAGEALRDIFHNELLHVVLGHLSENSNTQGAALDTVAEYVDLDRFLSFECGTVTGPTDLIQVGEASSLAASI